jgi:hypothetical protein
LRIDAELLKLRYRTTTRIDIDSVGIGFFGVTPVGRQAVNNLTATSGGTDDTIVDVGASYNQATLNNNFRDVSAKINEIKNALNLLGLL